MGRSSARKPAKSVNFDQIWTMGRRVGAVMSKSESVGSSSTPPGRHCIKGSAVSSRGVVIFLESGWVGVAKGPDLVYSGPPRKGNSRRSVRLHTAQGPPASPIRCVYNYYPPGWRGIVAGPRGVSSVLLLATLSPPHSIPYAGNSPCAMGPPRLIMSRRSSGCAFWGGWCLTARWRQQ